METAGPAFIKLGQWLTTRPDYFPPELCEVFRKLQDNVHPHSPAETRRAIKEAFALKVEDLFEEFELTPIGVGCVAQVHRATLKPEYREAENPSGKVAVKVLHNRAVTTIDRDLRKCASSSSSFFYFLFSPFLFSAFFPLSFRYFTRVFL